MVLKILQKVLLNYIVKKTLLDSTWRKGQSSNILLCFYYAGSVLHRGVQNIEKSLDVRGREDREQSVQPLVHRL